MKRLPSPAAIEAAKRAWWSQPRQGCSGYDGDVHTEQALWEAAINAAYIVDHLEYSESAEIIKSMDDEIGRAKYHAEMGEFHSKHAKDDLARIWKMVEELRENKISWFESST